MADIKPPIAPTKPHTWERPTGPVDDPWAWLANREDPDTIAYLEAENGYARSWFADHDDLVETIFQEIRSRVQETDLSVPVRHGPWWYVTRTVEGLSYPVYCRGDSIDNAADTVMLDCNVEAEGHDFFDVHAVMVVPRPPPARLVERPRRRRAVHAARARSRHRHRAPRRAHRHLVVGRPRLVAGQRVAVLRPPRRPMRPFQIWRHRLGSPPSDDVLVIEEPDERFYLDVSATRSEEWIVITTASKTSTEVWLIPAGDPTAELRSVRPRTPDLEYGVDHWGDRFVVLTNLDAPDFRVMTAPLDEPGAWEELLPHVAGRRITSAEPFAGHLVLHEWADAQPRIRVRFRDGTEEVLDFGTEPHDVELGANPEWDTTSLRLGYQSLTTPATVLRPRRRHRRADPAQADPDSQRRPHEVRVDADMGPLGGRHRGARRRRAPRRHRRRRERAVRGLRLRLVRGVAPAVVLGRPAVAARPGSHVGARAPAGRGRARASVVPRRQVAQQAQHVRRHARRRRARRSPRAGPTRGGSRSGAGARVACWWGRA